VVPVVGGQIGFHERLHALQWAGVGLILVGVLLLTGRFRRGRPASP
jgi:drug/metabolite transporter (DMT)-like permease